MIQINFCTSEIAKLELMHYYYERFFNNDIENRYGIHQLAIKILQIVKLFLDKNRQCIPENLYHYHFQETYFSCIASKYVTLQFQNLL